MICVHDCESIRQFSIPSVIMLEHKVLNYIKLISFIRDLLGPVCRLRDTLTVTVRRLLSHVTEGKV